jgi:hypothetical protein
LRVTSTGRSPFASSRFLSPPFNFPIVGRSRLKEKGFYQESSVLSQPYSSLPKITATVPQDRLRSYLSMKFYMEMSPKTLDKKPS